MHEEGEQRRLAELRAGMADLPAWLVVSRSDGSDPRPLLLEHLEYLADLQRRGALLASGPFGERHDAPAHGGVMLLRAGSAEEAHRILAAEPYISAGERGYELFAWSMRQGELVSRSDG